MDTDDDDVDDDNDNDDDIDTYYNDDDDTDDDDDDDDDAKYQKGNVDAGNSEATREKTRLCFPVSFLSYASGMRKRK